MQEHRAAEYIQLTGDKSKFLLELYNDKDRSLETEKLEITGQDFVSFYQKLHAVKERHKNKASELEPAFDPESTLKSAEFEEEALEAMFTGEESLGRYLDMNSLFQEYLNIKGIQRVPYIKYLIEFDRLADIPKNAKSSSYATYVNNLVAYLKDFMGRSQPLFNARELQATATEDFDKLWALGAVPGWPKPAAIDPSLFCTACILS